MMIWRRIRDILVMAITWALAWGALGSALAAARFWWPTSHDPVGIFNLPTILVSWAILGFLSGAVFSALLARRERRRSVDDLATARVAVWGALGGASLPVLATVIGALMGEVGDDWFTAPIISAALGAMCAAASLRLAKRPSRVQAAGD